MSISIGFLEFDEGAIDVAWEKIVNRSYLTEVEAELVKAKSEYAKASERTGDNYRELTKHDAEKEGLEEYWSWRKFYLEQLMSDIPALYSALEEGDEEMISEQVESIDEYLGSLSDHAHYGEYLHGQDRFVAALLNGILGEEAYPEYADVEKIPLEHWRLLLKSLTPELVNASISKSEIDPKLALDYLRGLKHVLKSCLDKGSVFMPYLETGDLTEPVKAHRSRIVERLTGK
jgi:hypothetical protein